MSPGASTCPLRVLYVLNTAAAGGSAGSLRFLLAAMPAGAIEAMVLCPDGPAADQFRKLGCRVITLPGVAMLQSIAGAPLRGWRSLTLLRSAWFLRHGHVVRNAITEFRPDIVHLNERGMFQAAHFARAAGVPVVMHARSVADRRWVSLRRLCDWLTSRYVDQIIAIDESVRWSIREQRPCVVIHNPLAPAKRAPRRPAADRRVRVAYLTGLLPFKGIWEVLQAAKRLRHRTDIVFYVAGANSRPREFFSTWAGRACRATGLVRDMESEVHRWVEDEGLESSVKLLGHVADAAELLAQTDIMLFPSHLNGPGRSVFEAGAYGIPSIVALEDRFDDVVSHGETGIVIPPRDASALADAIELLVDRPELRKRLGEGAERRATNDFTPEDVAGRVLELYLHVARRSSCPSQSRSDAGRERIGSA